LHQHVLQATLQHIPLSLYPFPSVQLHKASALLQQLSLLFLMLHSKPGLLMQMQLAFCQKKRIIILCFFQILFLLYLLFPDKKKERPCPAVFQAPRNIPLVSNPALGLEPVRIL
jgi:hypothetical protein